MFRWSAESIGHQGSNDVGVENDHESSSIGRRPRTLHVRQLELNLVPPKCSRMLDRSTGVVIRLRPNRAYGRLS